MVFFQRQWNFCKSGTTVIYTDLVDLHIANVLKNSFKEHRLPFASKNLCPYPVCPHGQSQFWFCLILFVLNMLWIYATRLKANNNQSISCFFKVTSIKFRVNRKMLTMIIKVLITVGTTHFSSVVFVSCSFLTLKDDLPWIFFNIFLYGRQFNVRNSVQGIWILIHVQSEFE